MVPKIHAAVPIQGDRENREGAIIIIIIIIIIVVVIVIVIVF